MPTSKFSQKQINELLFAQLQTINAVLSATMPGFNSDLEQFAHKEIDESTLSQAEKDGIKAEMTLLREKYKTK